MGRITASVSITNLFDRKASLRCDALVDTGAAYMVLPAAWKRSLGNIHTVRRVDCEIVTQAVVQGEVCGPVEIRIEAFEPIYSEVLFLEMKPSNGAYEPLIGYIVLEQAQVVVDMLGHRLVYGKRADLK